MCGIFGFFDTTTSNVFYNLGKYSETRGREASGYICIDEFSEDIKKFSTPFSHKTVKREINKLKYSKSKKTFIGHTRLKTHGDQFQNENNQPIKYNNLSIVHNGIIVNYEKLLKEFNLSPRSQLDSEVILLLLDHFLDKDSLESALKQTIKKLSGEASIAGTLNKGENYFLYTNTGSIYYLIKNNKVIFFSSEEWITKKIKNKNNLNGKICKLAPNSGIILNSKNEIITHFEQKCSGEENNKLYIEEILENFEKDKIKKPHLNRCKKCILPDTVPLIEFNNENVCNYCINYKKHKPQNFSKLLDKLRDEKNILVGFSGGRDSSFGLSKLKENLTSEFVAVSYDWGMITDLARRNQARVSGKLGVEHVWVSADILKKRENIKKNFIAWLSKPNLGMVPILMAGDKEWQKQLFKAAKNKETKYVVQFVSPFEHTYFKYSFAGIKPFFTSKIQSLGFFTKYSMTFKLALFYLRNFISNPMYLNSSLLDTLKGFFAYYFKTQNIISFFQYMEYDETVVNKHLVDKFNWEIDPSTPTTWRIGDGTAPVYNYIYWIHSGFTENDFFRSNQIREGYITREKALEIIDLENQPRLDLIKEYCNLIDLDYDFVMKQLENFKKESLVKNWSVQN